MLAVPVDDKKEEWEGWWEGGAEARSGAKGRRRREVGEEEAWVGLVWFVGEGRG